MLSPPGRSWSSRLTPNALLGGPHYTRKSYPGRGWGQTNHGGAEKNPLSFMSRWYWAHFPGSRPRAPAVRDLRGAPHIRHRPGEPPDSFLDLSGRERAKRQAEETFAATFGEEGESVGEIEGALRGRLADGGRANAQRQRDRDEEPAVGARRRRLRHEAVDRAETSVEPRRIEHLQPVDLSRQEPVAAVLEGGRLCEVARGDVRVLRNLGELGDERRGADKEP